MKTKRGFTLIEALSVISIISILASLAAFVYLQALRQSRDSKRKSDLTTIAQGFEARFLDLTCTTPSSVGQYPGTGEAKNGSNKWDWKEVDSLSAAPTDGCNPFDYYLSSIPSDPQSSQYYYNISSAAGLSGKHYRLTASLERPLSAEQNTDRCRQGNTWESTFGGIDYDGCPGDVIGGPDVIYNYVIGR